MPNFYRQATLALPGLYPRSTPRRRRYPGRGTYP
jgi:hypothetical protein